MPTFEVGIYNAEVRDLTKFGERHKSLDDSWENIHYFEFVADNEEHARRKAQAKYPPDRGYVVDQIIKIDYE
ncbi:MAG: hypothetical protein RIB59_09095 [Rhodospirillales bacterium]